MTLVQIRRDTAAGWAASNPVLAVGEPGMETDTGYKKIGDGASTWSALSYEKVASRLIGVSKLKAFGHSYVFGTGTPSNYGFADMLGDSLHANRRGRNYGIAGAVLAWDEAVTAGQGSGGFVRLGKYITAQQPGGPFPAYGQLYALMYGLNVGGLLSLDSSAVGLECQADSCDVRL